MRPYDLSNIRLRSGITSSCVILSSKLKSPLYSYKLVFALYHSPLNVPFCYFLWSTWQRDVAYGNPRHTFHWWFQLLVYVRNLGSNLDKWSSISINGVIPLPRGKTSNSSKTVSTETRCLVFPWTRSSFPGLWRFYRWDYSSAIIPPLCLEVSGKTSFGDIWKQLRVQYL